MTRKATAPHRLGLRIVHFVTSNEVVLPHSTRPSTHWRKGLPHQALPPGGDSPDASKHRPRRRSPREWECVRGPFPRRAAAPDLRP